MSAVTKALALRRLREDSPVISLMRQDTMAVIAAELSEHLGGDERSVPSAELYDLVDADLDELRRHGFDLPRSAQAYCADWLRAGFLSRHPAASGRGEVFEMSAAGHEAIRILERLSEPRPAATESRLSMISNELVRLATDTDESITSRVSTLEAERDRLDAAIEETRRGHFAPADPEVAAARLLDLAQQARDVPADFARVRDSMDSLNRQLRHDIIEDDAPQGAVLDDVFLGVDRIHDSPEGCSFDAFHAMVMDPEADARFTEAVEDIASRDFAATVDPQTLAFLRDYMVNLQHESLDVAHSMGSFSRSLREFVQSRQFEAFRELADRLRSAQRTGLEAARVLRLLDRMQWQLELTSPELRSVGRLALHVPSEVQAPEEVISHTVDSVDWEDLRRRVRESEIDIAEVQGWVAETVGARGASTVGEVLARHPATQGLASVVGLCITGARHGVVRDQPESVSWQTDSLRVAAVLSTTFTFEEVPDEWT